MQSGDQLHARRQRREPDADRHRPTSTPPATPSTTRSPATPATTSLDGGAGNDTMIGGAGNDTYVVDAAGDVVTEAAGEGTDTVQTSDQLHARRQCREPDADRAPATSTPPATAWQQQLTGNAGNNVLDGGAGNDTMIGGAGNDTYVVDAAGDVVTELAGEGTDTVQCSDQLHARRQRREPDADRQRRHQRHRQHARQRAHRQCRQQRRSMAAPATTP